MRFPRALLLLMLPLTTLAVNITNNLWYKVMVSDTTLGMGTAPPPKHARAVSRVACGSFGVSKGSYGLFCYSEGWCSLYSVFLGRLHNDSEAGPLKTCWTKYVCAAEGNGYLDGQEFDSCGRKRCENGTIVDVDPSGPPTCDGSFVSVANVGCFFISRNSDKWCRARQACYDNGGDLATPKDVFGLGSWVEVTNRQRDLWLGGTGSKWLNGSTVPQNVWASGQPTRDENSCITLRESSSGYKLADDSCGRTYYYICERKLN